MQCDIHSTTEACGSCVNCGRGVCDVCMIWVQGKLLCRSCVQKFPVDQLRRSAIDRDVKLKDPASAAAMSLLHGGLGQIYNGDIAKGIFLIGAKVIVLIGAVALVVLGHFIVGIACLILLWGGLWAWGIWDAYQSADRHNRAVQFSDAWIDNGQLRRGHF